MAVAGALSDSCCIDGADPRDTFDYGCALVRSAVRIRSGVSG